MRRARSTDEPAVLAVDERGPSGDRERQRLLRDAIAAGECTVYERDGEVLGYAIVKPRHFFGRDFIELLFVSAEQRRHGVGGALVRAALDSATTAQVFTSTNESNTAMQALLGSGRWSLSGRLAGLDDGDPELFYYQSRTEHRA